MSSQAASIHPSAIVAPGAQIGAGVHIGPYCIIGEHVSIGDDCTLDAHVVIGGHTRIGRQNRIFPFCALGGEPQDKKYAGEPTRLEIGNGNTIREHCTFSTGTVQDQGVTRIGNDNWIMANVHIAHDCIVGDHTIFANNVTLAGHVRIDDWVILGGLSAVHQFCRLGAHSLCAGGAILLQDLPPFTIASGNPAKPHGINSEGLRRREFSSAAITAIKRAYRQLYRSNLLLSQACKTIAKLADEQPEVAVLQDFLAAPSARGIVR